MALLVVALIVEAVEGETVVVEEATGAVMKVITEVETASLEEVTEVASVAERYSASVLL